MLPFSVLRKMFTHLTNLLTIVSFLLGFKLCNPKVYNYHSPLSLTFQIGGQSWSLAAVHAGLVHGSQSAALSQGHNRIMTYTIENVIFVMGQTDISHTMRLSSVWPINFQYHSQAAATGYSCVGYVKMAVHRRISRSDNDSKSNMQKAESSVSDFTVVGR